MTPLRRQPVAASLNHDLRVDRGQCHPCGKWLYGSRRAARRVMRAVHRGECMNVYRCPVMDGWHVGHRSGQSGGWS